MIGRLKGILELNNPPALLIDVQGVGYEVQAPMSTIYQLPSVGQSVVLHIHTHIREDAHLLYGFYTEAERALFRTLIKLSGVGPKLALGILSGMEVKQFIRCIENKELSALVRLPGVGKKTAERLLVEMAGKLKQPFQDEGVSHFSEVLHSPVQDAMSALVALGYKPPEASRALEKLNQGLNSQELIRQALRVLA